jgi:hypothetical protein
VGIEMKSSVFICSFSSGLDDMKRKDQSDVIKVLRVLSECKRYSVFEATANMTIARMMTRLHHKSYTIVSKDGTKKDYGLLIKSVGGEYPWTKIELTDGGKRLLEDSLK